MSHIIHEYYYVVGHNDHSSYYKLVIDRETEKMLYGDAYNKNGIAYGRVAIKKSALNKAHEVADRKYGLVLRVMVADDIEENAYKRAREIAYEYLKDITEKFLLYEREN